MSTGLMVNGKTAQAIVGVGRDTFRRLVRSGTIPSWVDPDTGTRWYFRLALEEWARNNGRPA